MKQMHRFEQNKGRRQGIEMKQEDNGWVAINGDEYLGETPLWSASEQVLYWVSCEDPPLLCRWKPGQTELESWPMPDRIGGLALRPDGTVVVCVGPALYNFNPKTSALSLLAKSPLGPHIKLHETCVDPTGRLWVGSYDERISVDNLKPCGGALFRLDGDQLIPMIPDLTVTNGLAFHPDGKVMYFTGGIGSTIWAVDIDPSSGGIMGMREFIAMAEGEICDGATVDAEGGYWLAMVSHGEIRRYLPDGTFDRAVKTICSQPTKPAFGGADLRTMFVTSTKMKFPHLDQYGPNGAVCALNPGVPGATEPFFTS
jgi:L-arabinonolactonase